MKFAAVTLFLTLAAALSAAQSQQAPAKKAAPKSATKSTKSTTSQPAAAKSSDPAAAASAAAAAMGTVPAKSAAKEAAPAAKPAAPKDTSMTGDNRVTQVYTPTLPPLPAGAVQIEKNAWRATDKDGKTYIYRRTPFGFSKYEADEVPVEEPVAGLVAIDKGDTVEFQRKTPFGLSKWTKKKNELDDNEAAALKQAAQSAAKSTSNKGQE